MAFSLDQANLGTIVNTNSAVTSFTLTTAQPAAAGALIAVAFGWFTNVGGPITSVSASGGGLTWTVPVVNGLATSTDACGLAWALAPAGLAASTVITITETGGANPISSPCAVSASWLGAQASSPLNGTSSKTYAAITAGAWSGTTIAAMTGASDLVVVSGWGDSNTGTVTTDTAGTDWTGGPVASQTSAIGGVSTLLYAMNVASTPNPSPWATWGAGAPTGTAVTAAAFLTAASTPYVPHRMPLGV